MPQAAVAAIASTLGMGLGIGMGECRWWQRQTNTTININKFHMIIKMNL